MNNKINGKPYPYMSLWQFLKYDLESLNNTYSRQKEKAFYVQCHYAKHKNQNNRYNMNLNFRICSEYKKKIQIVNQWIKEIEKIEQVKEENEQLKQQLKNEKQLNAEIKKRLVEVEYACEEFNHEYCDINCKGKRKETVDLYQLISDGLNETLLKQKDEENKQLAKRICELQSDLSKAKGMNEKKEVLQ